MTIGALDIPAAEGQSQNTDLAPSPRLFKATGMRKTPQVEWVEIQVKSVLNRVKGMPFEWSINPYRGCEHACVFCLSPSTPILMGDGSHKPLSDVRVGDWIYGTQVRGLYRRYMKTQVLARWEMRKIAYRITLEDGTELVASGDHRFLTDRGWKFVTGTDVGLPTQRPFLTVNNKLMGVGSFLPGPQKNSHYTQGYLTGLIRGDGHLGTYRIRGRARGDGHQFCLAMTDTEPLERATAYLRDFDIPTHKYLLRMSGDKRKNVSAIRTSARSLVAAVQSLVAWPQNPSLDWYKGFLAGIYDAEGSYCGSILQITNTDSSILDHARRGLTLLGFDHATEKREISRPKPLMRVRVRGGLRENLRFLHSVDPAITRKRDFEGRAVKSRAPLRIVAIESLGRPTELIDITTGTGDFIANGVISHNCYARVTHWYLDQDGVNDWSSKIFVKVNAPEVLRRELARPEWSRELVSVGTATDPYQPAEGAYRLTRRILEALRDHRTRIALITRSPMVVRDIDVLQQLSKVAGASVCFSLITMDSDLARELEPNVAPPLKRLEALRKLGQAGIRTAVNLAPVLPTITDSEQNLLEVIEAAKDYGASELWANALHLGEVVRDSFFKYLHEKRAHLIPEYERMYPKRYAPQEYQDHVQHVVGRLKAKIGFSSEPDEPEDEPPGPRQLQLFG